MVTVCCFQCDPRMATYIISILSFLHFTVETILLSQLDTEHRLVAEDDGIKFYTVLGTHIFLLVSSIALFFAAYLLIRFLCIPWLIGCTLNIIIYVALLVLIFMRLLGDFKVVELEKGLFIALTIGTISYCMWIVLVFFLELGKSDGTLVGGGHRDKIDSSKGTKSRSLFTLYDEGEGPGDEEQSLFPPKRHQDRVPLIQNSNN